MEKKVAEREWFLDTAMQVFSCCDCPKPPNAEAAVETIIKIAREVEKYINEG